jgi:hypothetical protein
MPRNEIDESAILDCFKKIEAKLIQRFEEKGTKSFTSSHEAMGVIDEEVDEAKLAVHDNDHKQLEEEFLDIIIAAMVGVMSIDVKGMDW